MKKISIYSIIGFLVIAVGCKGSKITQTKTINEPETVSNQQEEPEMAITSDTMTSESAADNGEISSMSTVAMSNGSTGGNANINMNTNPSSMPDDEDLSEMYSKLQMTDSQIQSLEMAMEDFKEKQRNMPNGEMLGTLASERERQLEDILSSEQLDAYENWKSDK